jgi:alcohol dehydrogenase class IV
MSPSTNPLSFQHLAAELRLFHGPDSLAALARELKRCGLSKAVVVSGRSVGKSPAMALLRDALGSALVGECTTVQSNSPVPGVEATARMLAELKADAVVAVGGGSAAVTGRAAAILLAEGRPARDLCTRRLANGEFDSPRLNAPKLPQFVVPTTPSTAFVKAGSAVHDPATGERMALFDPKTRMKAMFLHPEFLRTAPTSLVESASLNTLSTAVEALESPRCDPVSEALLMHALRLVGQHLHACDDLGARERLALAAVLCGRGTEQTGGGLASVLAHAIGHRSEVSNGIVNAIVLPHVLRFNMLEIAETVAKIGDSIGGTAAPGASQQAVFDACVTSLERLLGQLDIPHRLRDIGLKEGDLPHIAKAAMGDWFIKRNPRRVSDAAEVQSILAAAW